MWSFIVVFLIAFFYNILDKSQQGRVRKFEGNREFALDGILVGISRRAGELMAAT
jgi:hypothetical protein